MGPAAMGLNRCRGSSPAAKRPRPRQASIGSRGAAADELSNTPADFLPQELRDTYHVTAVRGRASSSAIAATMKGYRSQSNAEQLCLEQGSGRRRLKDVHART